MRPILPLLLGLCAVTAHAQTPVVDATSLLNTRLYNDGSLLLEYVDVVFAPESAAAASIRIEQANGTELARYPLAGDYRMRDKAFGRLPVNGHARWQAPGSGDYRIVVNIGGADVTRFPFSVALRTSSDPFDPNTTARFDGPWRGLGYLVKREYRDTQLVDLVAWVGAIDLLDGKRTDQSIARLYRGGTQIGHSRESAGHIDGSTPYKQQTYAFFAPHEARRAHEAPPIGIADLTDGSYEIRIERSSDGKRLRSFPFSVKNGAIVPHPRGTLEHKPRDQMLSPRVYRKGGNYEFHDVFWLTAGN